MKNSGRRVQLEHVSTERTVIAQITMEVQPVEIDGKHWVDVTVGGRKLKKRGPFKNASTAKAEADRIISEWAPAVPAITNDDVIVLNGKPTKIDSSEGSAFVRDACRAGESILSDEMLCQTYGLTPKNLEKLTENRALIAAVRAEGRRRVRSGQRAKEAAQGIFVKAPTVLDSIMSDERASPRHRIEAAKEIRQVAIGSGNESIAEAAERFTITINLGADVEPFKLDVDPKDIRHNTKQIESELDASE
jgi:hypothetical protein